MGEQLLLDGNDSLRTLNIKDTACVPDPNVELEDLLSAAEDSHREDDVFQSNTQESAML